MHCGRYPGAYASVCGIVSRSPEACPPGKAAPPSPFSFLVLVQSARRRAQVQGAQVPAYGPRGRAVQGPRRSERPRGPPALGRTGHGGTSLSSPCLSFLVFALNLWFRGLGPWAHAVPLSVHWRRPWHVEARRCRTVCAKTTLPPSSVLLPQTCPYECTDPSPLLLPLAGPALALASLPVGLPVGPVPASLRAAEPLRPHG